MKKLIYLSALIFLIAFVTTSCNKDKNSAEKFSMLSVEENKSIVENSGIDFVDAMKRMESLQTVEVLVSLSNISSSAGSKGFLFSKNSKLFSTLDAFIETARGGKDLNHVFDALVYAKELKGEDPQSIQEFWNDNVGTYTWNSLLSDWDIVLGGNKLIFLFPASDVSSTNNATLTISNYVGVTISNPLDEDYSGDLPVSLKAELKVGTKILVTFVFGASYNTDGVPNAIAADLTVETFKFEVDITNDTEVVSVNYKFLENDNVIMDLGAAGNGLFTEDNYNDNTVTHTDTYTWYDYVWNPVTQQYDEVPVTETNEWKETEFEEILNSANAHFQLFNIALKGDINVKGLVDKIRIIEEDYDNEVINDETADNRRASKINEFLNLRLINVTNNEMIAKAEAYVVHETDEWGTYSWIDFRLVFGDGSPIDVATYFNEGFDNFVTEMNELIADINSDYDQEIDPIEY